LNGGKFDSDNFNFTYKPKKKLTDFSDVPNFSSTTQADIVTAKNLFLGNYTLDGATFGNFETNLQISPVNSQYCISVKSSTPPTLNRHRFYSRSIAGVRENLLEPAKWYKASIVVKKLSGQLNWIFFRVARTGQFGAGVFFDIQNGVVGKETPYNPTFKGSIDNLQNGWYKCSITFRTDENITVPTQHFFAISFSQSDGPFVTSINSDPTGTLYTHVPGLTDCDIYISNSEIVLIDQLDIGDYSTINHLGGSALNVGRLQDSDWIQDYSYLLKVGQPVENYVESYKEILHPAGLRVVYEKEMTDYEGPGEGEDSSFICEYPILKNYSAYQLGITYNTVVGSFAGVSLYGLTCCDGYSSGFTLGFTGPAYYFPNWNGSINSFNFNDINIFDFFTMCFISGFTSPNEGITCATAPCE
jgi:hypothetical protein